MITPLDRAGVDDPYAECYFLLGGLSSSLRLLMGSLKDLDLGDADVEVFVEVTLESVAGERLGYSITIQPAAA
jgi:hypothetical protein